MLEKRVQMAKAGNPEEDYDAEDFADLFSDERKLARQGAPLKKVGEKEFMFIHKSFQEFFAARKMYRELAGLRTLAELRVAGMKPAKLDGKSFHGRRVGTRQLLCRSERPMLDAAFVAEHAAANLSIGKVPHLLQEVDTIKFLAGFAPHRHYLQAHSADMKVARGEGRLWPKDTFHFGDCLLAVVLATRENAACKVAAANAMTVLNVASIPLSYLDLHGICVEGQTCCNGLFWIMQKPSLLSHQRMKISWRRRTGASERPAEERRTTRAGFVGRKWASATAGDMNIIDNGWEQSHQVPYDCSCGRE
jgi:hypothetical protein